MFKFKAASLSLAMQGCGKGVFAASHVWRRRGASPLVRCLLFVPLCNFGIEQTSLPLVKIYSCRALACLQAYAEVNVALRPSEEVTLA